MADFCLVLAMCFAQEPIHIEDPLTNVVFKSITMKTVHGRRIFKDFEESEKMMAAGQ